VNVLSNLLHFYFREAFSLLNTKEVPTFTFLQDETAHSVIQNMNDW